MQHVCEAVYKERVPDAKLKQNVFQRLEDGNKLWEDLTGEGYKDWLTNSQYDSLVKCFQRRHLFDHQVGIVDQKYIDKSGDESYKVGQRIKLKKNELLQYISVVDALCSKVLEQRHSSRGESCMHSEQ